MIRRARRSNLTNVRGFAGACAAQDLYDSGVSQGAFAAAMGVLPTCGPLDNACQANNLSVSQLWAAASIGQACGPDSSAAPPAYQPIYMASPPPVPLPVRTPQGSTIVPTHGDPAAQAVVIPPPVSAPPYIAPAPPAAITTIAPAGSASSGSSFISADTGFDFSSIPWWAWLALAGGGIYLFSGGHR